MFDDLNGEAAPTARRRFVHTPTWSEIRDAVSWIVRCRQTGLIIGPAGVGKTFAAQQIARENKRAAMFVATPARSTVKSSLLSITDAFGIHTSREHALEIEKTLRFALRQRAENGWCLIVDEAQNLDLDAFRTVLFLHDEARLPIAFFANSSVLKRVRGKAAAFDRISDRLFFRVELEGATEGDIKAFGVEYNVEGSAAYELLVKFGLATSIRQTAAFLDEAREIAGPAGSLRLEHLKGALELLRGPEVARKFLKEIENHPAAIASIATAKAARGPVRVA